MQEPKKVKDRLALEKLVSQDKSLTKERKAELLRAVRTLPLTERMIQRWELPEWQTLHQHLGVYMGAIGGHISKNVCFTSLGDMETYKCAVCGEHAWVDDDF